MLLPKSVIIDRAKRYAEDQAISLPSELGYGMDGIVFRTSRRSALKVFERQDGYVRERNVYRRFHEKEVKEVRGHSVPQLLLYDDNLYAIEMSIVQPPYLLDFAKAVLDFPPDFSPEVIEEWHDEKTEQFGPQWHLVQDVMSALISHHGVYLYDINPGNITFRHDTVE